MFFTSKKSVRVVISKLVIHDENSDGDLVPVSVSWRTEIRHPLIPGVKWVTGPTVRETGVAVRPLKEIRLI